MFQDISEKLLTHYVDGAWQAPLTSQMAPVTNPTDESELGRVVLAGRDDVDRAVEAARAGLARFRHSTKQERLELLQRIGEVAEGRLEDLAVVISCEIGAPITMAREQQAAAGLSHLRGFMRALEAQPEREDLPGGDLLIREPVGVSALITPWNWPINQISLKMLAVIATGGACVLKPSEVAPISATIWMEIMDDAGVPAGVVNMIHGDGAAGGELAAHRDVDMVSFTGSTRAGREVMTTAAHDLRRVALELGGKSPNLVFADCGDALEARVRHAVAECFLNTGQSCDAPTRLLVEDSIHDRVVEIAAEAARETRVDDPAKPGDHLGPLVSEAQFTRVQRLIEAGIEEGARPVAGGPGRPEGIERGWWVRPTVFADVTPEMALAREEIFGPVLSIMRFDSEEDAIALANDTPYGLAAYIQTGDPARAERLAARLRAGAIHVNGKSMDEGAPFGGVKQSGFGREGGRAGLETFQEIKTYHAQWDTP
ncbi:aldehyde dehydrogenase family protein [Rhodobacteraceae bacterium WD3A24]|nr:aldehyde dehydrogenase family protein [Rhodobacteraceae bacterium WD3A24]